MSKNEIIITPSNEQQTIINAIKKGHNIIVDAVAGSGKTTTVLFIAKKNKKKKILQITYNKSLKFEVRDKIKQHNLKNIDVHSYHGLAYKYYKTKDYDDKAILNSIKGKICKKDFFDIIIIDEVQDMTPNLYEFIVKFIIDSEIEPIIIILGDQHQCVYQFKNADRRFLTFFDKIYNTNNFVNLTLQQSFRVTKPIANFVNEFMLGEKRIVSNKEGKNIIYFKENKFKIHDELSNLILKLITVKKYTYSDIFILAPSLKSTVGKKSAIKMLENKLVSLDIPVFYDFNEDGNSNDSLIKNKVVFSTFNSSKGRERKIVIIYSFDSGYFKYYNKYADVNKCPDELYVAVTRASELLILIEDISLEPLQFLNFTTNQLNNCEYIDYYNKTNNNINSNDVKNNEKIDNREHKTTVTELTKHLTEESFTILSNLKEQLFKQIKKPNDKNSIDIPTIITTSNGLHEDISYLNGLMIPTLYEEKLTNKSTIINKYNILTSNKYYDKIIKKNILIEKQTENKYEKYLRICNIYVSIIEQIHNKLNQIDNYDWLTDVMIDSCHKNLSKYIDKNAVYEIELGDNGYYEYVSNKYGCIKIHGIVDAMTDDSIYEFKCVSELQLDHFLQLILYTWIRKSLYNCNKKAYLLNIRTGELWRLKYDNYIIQNVIDVLLSNKYNNKTLDTDIEFINKHSIVTKKYV